MLILVEGMDFAGKSVLCRHLTTRVNSLGIFAKYNPGPLWHGPTRFFAELATTNVITLEWYRNISYLFAFYADRLFFRNPQNTIIFQETYIDRSIAYAEINNTYMMKPLHALHDLGNTFNSTIYLKASWETRLDRYKAQNKVHQPDEMRFAMKHSFVMWEKKLEELISSRKNLIVINTDDKSLTDVQKETEVGLMKTTKLDFSGLSKL